MCQQKLLEYKYGIDKEFLKKFLYTERRVVKNSVNLVSWIHSPELYSELLFQIVT